MAISKEVALNAIAALLSAPEWDAETLDEIADIMRAAGYDIDEGDVDDEEEDEEEAPPICRHTLCWYCGLDIEGMHPFTPGTWHDRGNNAYCSSGPHKGKSHVPHGGV